jgi:hypothetical protein
MAELKSIGISDAELGIPTPTGAVNTGKVKVITIRHQRWVIPAVKASSGGPVTGRCAGNAAVRRAGHIKLRGTNLMSVEGAGLRAG